MNNNKPRANILIVEDEDVLRKVLENTLTKLGYLVCNNFASAGEAIEYTKTHKPDIVLMDIQLRGEMDGIEAAERIYSEQKIPVVFLTSYADDVLLERAKLVGSFGYMLKPFKERELVATIDMALHKAKLERKLAESEEKHRLFFENSPIGIIHYNNNGIITEVNDSMISIFGSTREKLVGLDIDDIPDKKFSKEVYKSLEGEIGFYEDEYTSFTGKKSAIIKASWIPIIRDGEVISGVGIVENITERNQAEKELEQTNKVLKQERNMFISGPVVVFKWQNKEGWPVEYVSPNVKNVFGYSAEELLSGKMPYAEIIHKKDIDRVSNEVAAYSESDVENFKHKPYRIIRKDRKTICIADYTTILRDEAGKITHYMGYIEDITERKKVEEELRKHHEHLEDLVEERTGEVERSQKSLILLMEDVNEINQELKSVNTMLDATNKELEAFSYSVSHDLRAPLTRMDGFSKALLTNYSGTLDDQGIHFLNRIRASSQHMAKLIDDLLSLSRITREKVFRQKVDLSQIAGKIADELKASEPGRQVNFEITKGLSAKADRKFVVIILENLLGNAFKFTGKKENAIIEFGNETIDENEVFFIKDNGAGFDMKYYDKIFTAFQRLHSNEEYKGSGIGLAIVQRIINKHGGKIWAESEEGKGTTFYFRFE